MAKGSPLRSSASVGSGSKGTGRASQHRQHTRGWQNVRGRSSVLYGDEFLSSSTQKGGCVLGDYPGTANVRLLLGCLLQDRLSSPAVIC